MNNLHLDSQLSEFDLELVAARLEGLEETIIYRLLDRAQFARNPQAYEKGTSGFADWPDASLLDVRLYLHESMDSRFGRYKVPEERPFNASLPPAERNPPKAQSAFLLKDFDLVNQNRKIYADYISILDRVCAEEDDGHLGSCVELDVYALQAIARRVHYGSLYVAESKFLQDPEAYRRKIQDKDTSGILKALTRPEVEARILERVRSKLDSIQARVNVKVRRLVEAERIMEFYENTIIPLTKEGELAYLMNRP